MSIEAMKHYEAALLEAFPRGATGDVFEHWNNARKAIAEAEKQEPVASAWDEGYQAGINDERISEANIGIAGFDAKVEPARNNPYRTHPQPKREWVGLTDDEIDGIVVDEVGLDVDADEMQGFSRAIEAKLKEKNT